MKSRISFRFTMLLFFSALVMMGSKLSAQSITSYDFENGSKTYSTIYNTTGASQIFTGQAGVANVNLGFAFWYGGTYYTAISISGRGWMSLGGNITNGGQSKSLSTGTPRPIIAPFWESQNYDNGTPAVYIKREAVGTDSTFSVEFLNGKYSGTLTSYTISIIATLYKNSGRIEFVYRTSTTGLTPPTPNAFIGITSVATGTGEFLSVNNTLNGVSSTTQNIISARPNNVYVSFTPQACNRLFSVSNVIVNPMEELLAHYKMDGSAADAMGNLPGTFQGGTPTNVTDRFGNTNKALNFNGSSQYITTSVVWPKPQPTNFTISIWFKTNTTTGGMIMGLGSSQTGQSSNHDRKLYMSNSGKLLFGIYRNNSDTITVSSLDSYNDNNWHMATAVLNSSTGMSLYVDGNLIAFRSDGKTAQTDYNGYWRIGYDNVTTWPLQPTSFYFKGALDDAVIYHRALSNSEIVNLYSSMNGVSNNGPVCSGSTLNLTAPLGTVSFNYSWTGPAGFNSTAQSPSFTYTSSKAGEYLVTISNLSCRPATFSTVVTSITASGKWIGGVNSDWHNTGNWCAEVVPDGATDVTIGTGAVNNPVISSTTTTAFSRNLTIESGFSLTANANTNFEIKGNISNAGTVANNGKVELNGTGNQTITGINQFYDLVINQASSASAILTANTSIDNNITLQSGTLSAQSAIDLTVKGNWTKNAGNFSTVFNNVTFNGNKPQTIGGTSTTTFKNLIVNTTGAVNLAINTSLSGNLTVTNGTFDIATFTANRVSAGGALTVDAGAILKIGGTGAFPSNYSTSTLNTTSTVEYYGNNQTVAAQSYGNLTLSSSSGAATKTMPSVTFTVKGNLSSNKGAGTSVNFTSANSFTVNGNVDIGSATTFNGGNFTTTVGGNWTNAGTFSGNTGTVVFSGASKTISSTGNQNFNNLNISGANAQFTNGIIGVTGYLATTGTGSFTQSSPGEIQLKGSSQTISGANMNINYLNVTGSYSTGTDFNCIINDLTIANTASFSHPSGTIQIKGNLVNNGNFSSNGIYEFNGSSNSNISGSNNTNFYNLTVNKAVGNIVLSGTTEILVNGELKFVKGLIQTGNNAVFADNVTGAAATKGWVFGNLRKTISSSLRIRMFEVGDANAFTPISYNFNSVSAVGYLTVATAASDHPNINTSEINSTKSVNRYWKVLKTGSLGFDSYSIVLNYLSTDVDAGINYSSIGGGTYNSTTGWSYAGTATGNSTQSILYGLTSIGDLAAGEICFFGTSINYPASPFCQNSGSYSVTLVGTTGGVFSASPAGLAINSSSGLINSVSPANTYTVNYTLAAITGCKTKTVNTLVEVKPSPAAAISYGAPLFCPSGTQGVTITGTPTGTFSATPSGLSLNTSTGLLNLATSSIGNYTVSYSVSEGGCSTTATTPVEIRSSPYATISYSKPKFCSDEGYAFVTITGTTGGLFSSTTGLVFSEPPAGTIDLANSTPQTYLVNYNIPAISNCPMFNTTTSVGIEKPGFWKGINTAWETATSWTCDKLPTLSTDVVIPGSLTKYPVITSSGSARNLTIQGGTVTVAASGTINIAGQISATNTLNSTVGTVNFAGSAAQNIAANTLYGNQINNLTVSNPTTLTLNGKLDVSGVVKTVAGNINTNDHLTLLSSASKTALIYPTGSGQVNGKVTMQRYLSSSFGYNYVSSPFSDAKVSELQEEINLNEPFATFYRYDENVVTTGWIKYTGLTNPLVPFEGYAGNFGNTFDVKTINMSGSVNNGNLTTPVLYNHNHPYTKGFHLVGNPYPSPIDWNASAGWTKTNIDDAIYFFNAGTSDRYTGTYSSYINGVSSDGVTGNIIPSMQGFFVHVKDAFPAAAQLSINNLARTMDLNPAYHFTGSTPPLLRISARFADSARFDPTVIYIAERSGSLFSRQLDALKIDNTDEGTPNLYSTTPDAMKLSIRAVNLPADSTLQWPLGLKIGKSGTVRFKMNELTGIDPNINVLLYDNKTNRYTNLRMQETYAVSLSEGEYLNRFYIVFSKKGSEQDNLGDNRVPTTFDAFVSNGSLTVKTNLSSNDRSQLMITNMMGQKVWMSAFKGSGNYDLKTRFANGVYVVTLYNPDGNHSKKIFIQN